MSVNGILENLYKSNDLNDCIKKMVRPDHQQDFKQELFLLLYEKPQDLILTLYNTSGLTYYVVRVVLNLVNQKRNVYHKKYNDYTVTYDSDKLNHARHEETDLEERLAFEARELHLLQEVNKLDETFNSPYYRALIDVVNNCGSMREAARQTGIDVSVISRAMKKVRTYLNSIYNGEDIKGVY